MTRRSSMLAAAVVALFSMNAPADDVARWRVYEGSLTGAGDHAAPLDVDCDVTFTGPNGSTATCRAFWDGDRSWRVRFSPGVQGTWHWKSDCDDDPGQIGRAHV